MNWPVGHINFRKSYKPFIKSTGGQWKHHKRPNIRGMTLAWKKVFEMKLFSFYLLLSTFFLSGQSFPWNCLWPLWFILIALLFGFFIAFQVAFKQYLDYMWQCIFECLSYINHGLHNETVFSLAHRLCLSFVSSSFCYSFKYIVACLDNVLINYPECVCPYTYLPIFSKDIS